MGEYGPGDQLPSERELAQAYQVTRSTARRSLRDLEQMGLVFRDGARGTRVRTEQGERAAKIVTLVCTSEPISAADYFLQLAIKQVEGLGWGTRILRLAFTESMDLLRSLNVGNDHLIYSERLDLIPGSKLCGILANRTSRVVVIGNDLTGEEVPSVVCNDDKGMRLALDHLRKKGHERIALLCGREKSGHVVLNTLVQQWRNSLSLPEAERDDFLVHIEDRPFESLVMEAYQVTREFLGTERGQQATALLCLKEELTVGAMAACRDMGRSVPESVSVIEYAPTPRALLAETPRTMIDVHMKEHVDLALSLLQQKGRVAPKRHQVEPSLVEGKTVADLCER